MIYALDSCVGFKWLVVEQDTDKARKLRDEYRQAMHDLFVDRNADLAGVFSVSQKGAFCAVMLNPARRILIHLFGGEAWFNKGCYLAEHRACYGAGRPHRFEISLVFQDDHVALNLRNPRSNETFILRIIMRRFNQGALPRIRTGP